MGILEINFQGFVSPEAYWASDQPPVLISSNDADIHLRDYIYEDEPQREQLFASPKKTRKPPPTIPGSRALQKSVSKSCRKQVQTSIDQAQHLPKLSSDASRRKLVTYQHRTEYAIPILTSASARLPAKATARDKAPCRRPELEDLPEAVVFQIEEMDLLP